MIITLEYTSQVTDISEINWVSSDIQFLMPSQRNIIFYNGSSWLRCSPPITIFLLVCILRFNKNKRSESKGMYVKVKGRIYMFSLLLKEKQQSGTKGNLGDND